MMSTIVKERKELKEFSSIFSKYEKSISNPLTIVTEANKGITANAFFDVAILSGVKKDLLADLLNTSLKTLIRYRHERKKLNPANSEQILKLIALYKKGIDVFGDVISLNKWLEKPAFGLGYQTPINLMRTSSGIDLIRDELNRIEYGDLA